MGQFENAFDNVAKSAHDQESNFQINLIFKFSNHFNLQILPFSNHSRSNRPTVPKTVIQSHNQEFPDHFRTPFFTPGRI